MRRRHLPGRPPAQGQAAAPVAVGYLRRSTDRQEQSIPDQKQAVEAHAADNGLRLTRLYVDDAISGTSATRRRAFQELIDDAQKPGCPFRYVVVYDVKRFGRVDNDEAGYYRHILKMHGVEVLYVSENFNGDGTDDLLRPVKQWQAREESKDLSKVTIRGLLSKVQGGWWMGGTPPYGYDLRYENERGEFLFVLRFLPDGRKEMRDEKDRLVRTLARGERVSISKRDRAKLAPSHPDRVTAIERIFRMAAEENKGYASIAGTLNDDGVPTPRGPAWSRIYSGKWVSSTIREILLNPAYVGDMVWNRRTDGRFHKISNGQATERRDAYGARLVPNPEEDWILVPNTHPPLISRRLFENAKQAREARAASRTQRGRNPRVVGGWRGKRARYLLSGLVECARCGGRYEGCVRTKGKPRKDGTKVKTHYYGCGTYIRRGKSACRFGPIKQEVLESAAVATVIGFYEERYGGKDGRKRLRKAIKNSLGTESRDVVEAQRRAESEREELHAKIATLLDNITPANRSFVDARLKELDGLRSAVERRLGEFEEVGLQTTAADDVMDQVRALLATLAGTLRDGTPEQRVQAIRQCVEQVVLDTDTTTVRIRLRLLPALALDGNTEVVEAPLQAIGS